MSEIEKEFGATPLWRLAKLIRSKNAGPFNLTIDIMFENQENYLRVKTSGTITAESISGWYGVPVDVISVFEHDHSMSIKVSFPRPTPSGSVSDTDIFGGTFHSLLVDLAIP
jgi:hypothetical protein